MKSVVAAIQIEKRIYVIRGHKVMLDSDLAELYGVPTKALNLAVRRNKIRFPKDFMFQLTPNEKENLRFQFETSSWGGRRYLPFVFTEQGVAMLSSVLQSKRAALVNIRIMRAFVKLRDLVTSNKELAKKVIELEKKFDAHDGQLKQVFSAIYELMTPPIKPRSKIGFKNER